MGKFARLASSELRVRREPDGHRAEYLPMKRLPFIGSWHGRRAKGQCVSATPHMHVRQACMDTPPSPRFQA